MLRQIERTDNSQANSRIESAANRLQAWYNREHNKLTKNDLRLQIELSKEPDKKKRDAMVAQLKRSGERLQELNEGMRRSTILPDQNKTERTRADAIRQSELRIASTSTIPGRMPNTTLSTKSKDGDSPKKLTGLAAIFNSPTTIYGYLGSFREQIAKGAFADVLSRADLDCKFLFNHQSDYIMSSTPSKSLRLYESNQGLLFWSDTIRDDPLCLAILQRVENKILTGCSFAFIVAEDGDVWKLPAKQGDITECTITKIAELFDVCVCTNPAYSATTVEVVSERETSIYAERPGAKEDLAAFEEQEYQEFLEGERLQKRHIEIGYKQAGRIINRINAKKVTA